MSDEEYGDPFDHEQEYAEWLMQQDLRIANGNDLIRHMEAETRYDEFMEGKNAEK